MSRVFFAMVLGLGIGLMGCAVGVDDPVPPAPAPEEQRDPPNQALGGQLRAPQQQQLSDIALDNGLDGVPAEQVFPVPLPMPEQH